MLKGTRCSRLAFMRPAGMVHTFASRSISSQVAPIVSQGLQAVKIVNSSARAAMPSRSLAAHEVGHVGERQRLVMLDLGDLTARHMLPSRTAVMVIHALDDRHWPHGRDRYGRTIGTAE